MHLSVSPCKPLLLASDLAEACEDEEFVVNDMQANEISNKGFKRRPFIKAVNAATRA
jgi:hypothetical protein